MISPFELHSRQGGSEQDVEFGSSTRKRQWATCGKGRVTHATQVTAILLCKVVYGSFVLGQERKKMGKGEQGARLKRMKISATDVCVPESEEGGSHKQV